MRFSGPGMPTRNPHFRQLWRGLTTFLPTTTTRDRVPARLAFTAAALLVK